MDNIKRPAASYKASGKLAFWSSSFSKQPARVLIVEALPPWWSETSSVVCDALDNFLSLACNLDGPRRIPLLSLYAISRQQECLLPFVQVHGNLARLRLCVEELRSIPGEGCVKRAAGGGELLQQAVLNSLQQFKQYVRHISTGNQTTDSNLSVEVTVVTSQPGQGIMHQLEMGLKDTDVVSLKQLLVVEVYNAADLGQESPSPETTYTEAEDSLMSGLEIELQRVENTVSALESVFKEWLQEQGGDREQLHLLLPSHTNDHNPVCIKCDMQERLISPALIPVSPNLGVKTESTRDFLSLNMTSTNQSLPPQRLKVIKALHAVGLCESVLYGLPLVVRPTTCWRLDWEELETNNNLFHALCHTLQSRDLFLLLQVEPRQSFAPGGSGVYSHLVLQSSSSLSLLLKPVASRELLLPCSLPVSTQDPTLDAMKTIQSCLTQLDEDSVFNPLSLSSNLYQHLRRRGLISRARYPYRLQPAAVQRDQSQPPESAKSTAIRQPCQAQNQRCVMRVGSSSRVKATVPPMPFTYSSLPSSSSSVGPASAKAPRVTLTFRSSKSGGRSFPDHTPQEEKDDDSTMI